MSCYEWGCENDVEDPLPIDFGGWCQSLGLSISEQRMFCLEWARFQNMLSGVPPFTLHRAQGTSTVIRLQV